MTAPRALEQQTHNHLDDLVGFLHRARQPTQVQLPAVSLFSGGGLGDLGYEQVGFQFCVQAELHNDRAALCATNFPDSDVVVGPVGEQWGVVAAAYHTRRQGRLQLLSATPPCQGMSSSNPGRGRHINLQDRDARNRLLLDVIPVVATLRPRIVVAENVMQALQEQVRVGSEKKRLIDAFREGLPEYQLFTGTVQIADYGVPQVRKRAIIVAIHQDEPCLAELQLHNLLPWPRRTHAEQSSNGYRPWVSLETWLGRMNYPPLDAGDEATACSVDDPLHYVPVYEGHEYFRVADIPARSGLNAYQNANCRVCDRNDVPEEIAHCNHCGAEMINRPYVREPDGTFRLIKGFKSSYRRMFPDRPAQTITTASSHVGSDYKIHPWEHRVFSVRECADLQTIPRFYDWSWAQETRHNYLVRQVIGEALPPWFTHLHGRVLRDLLAGRVNVEALARQPRK